MTDLALLYGFFDLVDFDLAEALDLEQRSTRGRVDRLCASVHMQSVTTRQHLTRFYAFLRVAYGGAAYGDGVVSVVLELRDVGRADACRVNAGERTLEPYSAVEEHLPCAWIASMSTMVYHSITGKV